MPGIDLETVTPSAIGANDHAVIRRGIGPYSAELVPLGSAASASAGAFATAAQGTLADSALQAADLVALSAAVDALDLTASDHEARIDALEAGGGGGGSQYIQHFIPLAPGSLIDAAVNSLSQTTQAGATNRCDFVPFMPNRNITVSSMGGEVTTGVASSNFLLGIYGDNGSGKPGNKLVESATLSGVTVQVLNHTIPGGFTFQAGTLYWLAFLSSSTTTFRALAIGGMHSLGLVNAGAHGNIWRGTAASFALPATAMGTALTSAPTPQMRFTTA